MKNYLSIADTGYIRFSIDTMEVKNTLYLTDKGWTVNGDDPEAHSPIPPGLYNLEYIFINSEGDVGFNYSNLQYHPEFVGKDIYSLTQKGHIIFTKKE